MTMRWAGNTSNPYSETSGDAWRPVMMNRPFRSVGEMGYAFRDQPFKTLSFSSTNSPDAGLLDLFTVNDVSDARNPTSWRNKLELGAAMAPGCHSCECHPKGEHAALGFSGITYAGPVVLASGQLPREQIWFL